MKKFNILALLVFVAGLVGVFTFDTEITRQIQSRVLSLLSPFIHSSAAMQNAAESLTEPQVNAAEVMRERDELRVQVERGRIVQQKYNQIIEENAKLRQIVGFQQAAPFKMTAAKVIRRRSSAFWNSLIIDKGSLDGIGTDSPVITSVGLVGKTSILAPRMTEVILLTDEMCRVSAKVEGTLEQGILAGERAALEVRPELHLRFLSRNANINAGASVYSSGEGGVFPPDLLLGRVKRFENREISGEAIVEPAVDFSSLDHVFVIEMQAVVPAPEPPATTKP
jgi:rod shape-determining protein MreC